MKAKTAILTLCVVLVIAVNLTLFCIDGIGYWAFRSGILDTPSVGGKKITMKDGWYPHWYTLWKKTRVQKNGKSAFDFVHYGYVRDCSEVKSILIESIPKTYLSSENLKGKIASVRDYPWGAASIGTEQAFGSYAEGYTVIVAEHALVIKAKNLSFLDDILAIEISGRK